MYSDPKLAQLMRARCHDSEDRLTVALNIELPQDGTAPEWLELLPAGDVVEGRDGRSWFNPEPQQVIAMTQQLGKDIVLDWEHATELKAPQGDKAPAAAWIKDLEVRDGAIWGRLEWTKDGHASVTSREYRYISPVFDYTKDSNRIMRITSAGLTNKPNLYLTALNQSQQGRQEDDPVKLSAAIRKALGLPEDATEEQGVTAINQMQQAKQQAEQDLATARNSQAAPSLDSYVPRADYDSAMNHAKSLQDKLDQRDKDELEDKIQTAINSALDAGKITPATVEYHTAQCRQEGGLDRFKEFVEKAPAVGDDTDLGHRIPESDKDTALNQEQAQIAGMFGNSAEDLERYGK